MPCNALQSIQTKMLLLINKTTARILFLSAFFLSTSTKYCSGGESSTCLAVYREGGAPAVFQSPKCPRWKLSSYRHGSSRTTACQSATLQGRRKSLEDRTFCSLDVRIPFLGAKGCTEVLVGIVAVFDGHNGAEASEMASMLLLEYFILHTHFLLDATYKKFLGGLPNKEGEDMVPEMVNLEDQLCFRRSRFSSPLIFDRTFHLDILKKSLLGTIQDIDTVFSKEASKVKLNSGSTATIILLAEGQILVANVGDSKALLCYEKFQSPAEAKATLLRLYRQKRRDGAILLPKKFESFDSTIYKRLGHFFVKELSRDHHPDRDDERFRVENAGGHVIKMGGVPRVNGELAISRAIGDVSFKSYGVISAPEVTDWQPLTLNDSYLVVASDGLFEKLSPQDVCDLLWEVDSHPHMLSELSSSCSFSLADCLVNTAFDKGSMDNIAAVVVPLRSTGFSQTVLKDQCDGMVDPDSSASGLQNSMHEQTSNSISADSIQLDHAHPLGAKFDRLLVEGKHGRFCFYLSKDLNEETEYTWAVQEDDRRDIAPGLLQGPPMVLVHYHGGPLNLYSDQNVCFHIRITDGASNQCFNLESFSYFLGLIESIPFHVSDSGNASSKYAMPGFRYKLKKRFGHGSYGEVWLAFHWDCSQENDRKPKNFSSNLRSYDKISWTGSFSRNCDAHSLNTNMFILKRIMVERGTAVYLSGLREKYFGEIFLNASRCLGGSLSYGLSNYFSEESKLEFYGFNEMKTKNVGNLENKSAHMFGLPGAVHEEGLNHIARYMESFESQFNEIWLVFRHEGVSLSKLIYTVEEIENNANREKREHVNHAQILHQSKWWHWLKTTEAGHEEMRNLIWQLLMSLKSCHDRNITHRDIKPENMVICFEDQDTGRCLKAWPSGDEQYITKMRLIDFGSAIDPFTLKHLYGSAGPSRAEQTYEYTPPEALLNATWFQGPTSTILKYDMWSVGIVILELILGSPNVFQISVVTHALLDQYLKGWNENLKELAYKLRSLMELCILIPGSSLGNHHMRDAEYHDRVSPASWRCSEEFFSSHIKSRDPLKLGFPNIWAMRLVRQLLRWNPEDRLSVDEALRHPYFQTPAQS